MPRVRFLGRIAAAAACAALLLGSGAARAAEPVSIGIIGGVNALVWPYIIGIARGAFAAQGLDVSLVSVQSSAAAEQQVAAGSLDVSTSTLIDEVRAIAKGAPDAILRVEGQAPPYDLVAKPSIKTIKDLKGKTVIVAFRKAITAVYLERVLKANGMNLSEVNLVFAGATNARFSALLSGGVDATLVAPPFNFLAEAKGFTNLGTVVNYARNLPFTGSSANRAWVASHKDAAQKMIDTYGAMVAWFDDDHNRAAAAKILAEKANVAAAEALESYDFFRKIQFFSPTGAVSTAQLAAVNEVLLQSGDIKAPMPMASVIMPGLTKTME